MSKEKIKILERTLEREREARKEAETILESKSLELFNANQKLASTNKMMEILLDDQSIQLNIIIENSPLGIVLTEKGKLIKINTAFQNILGYTHKELNLLTVKDISHPGDLFKTKKYIKQIELGEIDNFIIKKRYKRKDGTYVTCKTNVSAVRDTKGNIKYQVAIIEDITFIEEQSRMLYALNQLSISILGKRDLHEIAWEIARSTADNLELEDCVVYVVDKEAKSLTQVAAYGNKNPVDYTISNLLSVPIGEGIVGTVAITGIPELINDTSVDDRYIVDDYARLSELAVPIIVENEVIGVIDSEHSNKNYFNKEHLKTFTNIANLAAAQLNNALSLLKEQRVTSEKNKLLVKLEKSNEELKNFAHVVSHDLKSPLRSMSALMSWIQEDNEDKFDHETNENFERLLKKVDKMDHYINGILKYSSIDKINKNYQEVDLQKIIDDIIQIIHIPQHVNIKIKSQLPILYSDKFRLQQLFQNLISNAIKYNNKPKGLVEIDCKEKKNTYLFSVKDNGIGIESKYHSKIFKVFETLENPDEKSTGIGLSIVKKIIAMFDGKIWIESTLGEGSTFFFEIKKEIPKT